MDKIFCRNKNYFKYYITSIHIQFKNRFLSFAPAQVNNNWVVSEPQGSKSTNIISFNLSLDLPF